MSIVRRIERLIEWLEDEDLSDEEIQNDVKTELRRVLSDVKYPQEETRYYTVIYDQLATIRVAARNKEEAYAIGVNFLDNHWDELEWTPADLKDVELDEVEEDEE